MKKAFTLIEMLGIIILLGLIGLIVYPTTIKIINDSKEELYQKNISELERLAISWASVNEDKLPSVDKKGYYLKIEELKKDGFIDGEIKNPKTDEEMQGCVGIIYDETKDKHNYQYFEDCTNFQKPTLSNLKFSTLENEYGWRNQDFYVTLESEYLDSYEYCISDSKCNPNVKMNASDKILVNQEGIKYVCAKGSNTVGDTTTECALYRLDKTKPVVGSITFSGTKGLNDWYISDVAVTTTKSSDALSGIASDSLSPSVTTITTDTSGTTYTLTAKDLAGNEASVSYSVKIDKTAPIVGTLNITGTKGDNDWYISDVTFTVNNGSDATSGHVSTTINTSSITTDTKGTKVILTTTDKAGNTSTQEYNIKVDKTKPTVGTATFVGTLGSNNWYTSNVTVNVINGSDATSGHASTTSNITSITSDTSGTTITITTSDKAGNTSTQEYNIKVDKTPPTVPTVTYNGGSNTCSWKTNYNLTLNSTDANGIATYQVDWDNDNNSNSNINSNFIPWDGYSSCNNRFRAVDNAGNVSDWTTTHHIHMDTSKPTITKTWWGTVNADKAQLYIQASDNTGITKVQCPTSTATGNYNNWHWFNAVWDSSQNAYRCDITTSTFKHYNQTYKTHIYMYDNANNGGFYQEKTVDISNPLTSIAITTMPNKTQYSEGDAFDVTGMVVTATYQNGVSLPITNYSYDFTYSSSRNKVDGRKFVREEGFGFHYLKPGYNYITVSYTEGGVTATTEFNIRVTIKYNQITKAYVVPRIYRINKITNWSTPDYDLDEVTYDNPNDWAYYTLGSNYIEVTNTSAGYFPILVYDFYVLLNDGTYWRNMFLDDSVSFEASVSHKITKKGSSKCVYTSIIDKSSTSTGDNVTKTTSVTDGLEFGITCSSGTSTNRHTINYIKFNGNSFTVVVEDKS